MNHQASAHSPVEYVHALKTLFYGRKLIYDNCFHMRSEFISVELERTAPVVTVHIQFSIKNCFLFSRQLFFVFFFDNYEISKLISVTM